MPAADLSDERYVSLTTFRRSGEPVSTPVWAAPFENGLVVGTFSEAGKIKRIRATDRVTVAPCNFRGLLRGPAVEAQARVLDPEEYSAATAALVGKYGWQWRLFGRQIDAYLAVR